MRAARTPWPVLIGSLALGCLLSQPGGAQWDTPPANQPAANPPRYADAPAATGGGQVRFVPRADVAASTDRLPADQQGATQAVGTNDSLADPSDEFAITADGEVVQTAYHSAGTPLRTGPATRGNLIDSLSSQGSPSGQTAAPTHRQLFSRDPNVSATVTRPNASESRGRPTSPAARSVPSRLSQSRTPTRVEPVQATAELTPTPARAGSAAERLLVQAHEWATTAATQQDFSRIVSACRRCLDSQRDGPAGQYAQQLASWALNRRGQLLAGAGHASEAMHDFEEAIHLDPRRWRAVHNRGVLLAQAGQFERAFDDFGRTIQLQPDYAKAYSNRAALLVVAGKVQQAADDYRQATKLDPGLAVAHRGLGRCCHALGRLDEALQHFDAAVELEPNSAYTLARRADLLTDLGHYAEAAADYDRAIRLDSQSVEAYRGSAWLLATCPDNSVRNPELAVNRAKQALQLDRKHEAVSYDTLAAALANAGQYRGAVETARRAVELAPSDERVVYQDRLQLYQRSQPFRIAPLHTASQVSYER